MSPTCDCAVCGIPSPSYLAMGGPILWAIQRFLGHKDLRMTERCAHLSADYLQQAG
jgi:site-specific recombinase XerD